MRDFSKLYFRINKALDSIESNSESYLRIKESNKKLESLERKIKIYKKLSTENEELVTQVINNILKLIKK